MIESKLQKIILITLSCLLLVYIAVEVWFATAFINSASINSDLSRLHEFEGTAISLSAFSITVNILIFLTKKYVQIEEYLVSICLWISTIIGLFFAGKMIIFGHNDTVIGLFFMAIVLLPWVVKWVSIYETFVRVVAILAATFWLFLGLAFSIHVVKTEIYSNDDADDVLCYVASEHYKDRRFTPWRNESVFTTVEQYQLEKILFSIRACESNTLRAIIAKDIEFKSHIKALYWKRYKIDIRVKKYQEIINNFDDAINVRARFDRWPNRFTVAKVFTEMRKQGYNDSEITEFFDLIGVKLRYGTFTPKRTKPLRSNEELFRYMIRGLTDDPNVMPYRASAATFKKVAYDDVFEKNYKTFQETLNFSHLAGYEGMFDSKYRKGAVKELLLVLSIVTTVLSILTLVFLCIEMAGFFRHSPIRYVLFAPILWTAILLLGLMYFTPKIETNFPSDSSETVSILELHFKTFPYLKKAFTEMGFSPWLNTYTKLPNKQASEATLKERMEAKLYLTPITSSALLQMQQMKYINDMKGIRRSFDAELSEMEEFYLRIGDTEKLNYVREVSAQL